MFNTLLQSIKDYWKKFQTQNTTQDNNSYTMGGNNYDNTTIYDTTTNSEPTTGSDSGSLDNSCISDTGSSSDSCDSGSDSSGSSD